MSRACDAIPNNRLADIAYYISYYIYILLYRCTSIYSYRCRVILCAPWRLLLYYYNNTVSTSQRCACVVVFFAVPSQKGCFDSLFRERRGDRRIDLYLPPSVMRTDKHCTALTSRDCTRAYMYYYYYYY